MSFHSDEDIIKGCLQGKRKAQLALYNTYRSRLFGVCMRYLANKQDAEDAFQDGFVKIFTGIKTFKQKDVHSFFAWMKRIMSNTCLNYLRDIKKYRLTMDLDDNFESEAENDISLIDIAESVSGDEIMEIVLSLPDGYRTIFNLYALEGFSHAEIAEIMKISVSTSKTQLMKARRAIAVKIIQKLEKNNNKVHSFNYIYK